MSPNPFVATPVMLCRPINHNSDHSLFKFSTVPSPVMTQCCPLSSWTGAFEALLGSMRGRNQAPAVVAAPKESVPGGKRARGRALLAESASLPTNLGPWNSWKAFLRSPQAEEDAMLAVSARRPPVGEFSLHGFLFHCNCSMGRISMSLQLQHGQDFLLGIVAPLLIMQTTRVFDIFKKIATSDYFSCKESKNWPLSCQSFLRLPMYSRDLQ